MGSECEGPVAPAAGPGGRVRATAGRRLIRRLVHRLGRQLIMGSLVLETPGGDRIRCEAPLPGPEAVLVLHRWRALSRLVLHGDVGFAEAYMAGDWSSPDLTRLIELAALNEDHIRSEIDGTWPRRLLNRLAHLRKSNTRAGSRRNIMRHYDLGNEFYAQWLDEGMSYSSAVYAGGDQSLEAAQLVKQDRVRDLLALRGGESVLEIGCGWGGMAEALIRRDACRVTGLTLSPAQLDYAQRRLGSSEIAAKADFRLQDYRDVGGTYDRIVSIEMLEAVGRHYWPTYFRLLGERLAEGGVAVLQVITIAEAHFENYCRNPDFIQRHIFPGGMLPSVSALRREIEAAGLRLTHAEHFGQSYARTLAVWQQRFQQAWPAIERQGFGQRFKRMWEYYLAYCEAGFRAGACDVGLYRIEQAAPGGWAPC